MANTGPEKDIDRAKKLRALAKGVRNPDAIRGIEDAADRLEARAAKKLGKVGKPKRKPAKLLA